MSTKCTVLSGKNFHFFFEQMDGKYHLSMVDDGFSEFLQRAGKLLDGCPFGDSGLYLISLKKGVKSKVFKSDDCPHMRNVKKSVPDKNILRLLKKAKGSVRGVKK